MDYSHLQNALFIYSIAILLMQCDKVKLYLLDKTTKQARDYRQKRRTNQIVLTKSIINLV